MGLSSSRLVTPQSLFRHRSDKVSSPAPSIIDKQQASSPYLTGKPEEYARTVDDFELDGALLDYYYSSGRPLHRELGEIEEVMFDANEWDCDGEGGVRDEASEECGDMDRDTGSGGEYDGLGVSASTSLMGSDLSHSDGEKEQSGEVLDAGYRDIERSCLQEIAPWQDVFN
ncbi:hypothetical protein ACLMJK_004363 [Lecanora helva]